MTQGVLLAGFRIRRPAMPVDVLGVERNFAGLSTKDLLDARDQYHWHLIHKRNVVGTAVGLYHIRKTDPWPTRERPDVGYTKPRARAPRGERTFENSEVRDYSWPCVLVLVERWQDETEFGTGPGQVPPEEIVPKTLYMPDGRTVPVCVIKVSRTVPDRQLLPAWHWPEHLIGGGFPIISTTQGRAHVATAGALVTDGHSVYVLTSRHVGGPKGHPITSIVGGRTVEIGVSSERQITRRPFTEVYPEFAGRRTFLTIDAALIEVSNVDDWTSQVYGLPTVGELADLSERNISTRLINAEVVAYGAASGALYGRIAALFYRHRSIGGYDDVTDFLIAPLPGQSHSQPGDSGTVWHLRQKLPNEPLRPIALQWGGQAFLSSADGDAYNFALASGLTNVLRLLEVELVVDHNTGAQPFWGKTGHYGIATFACDHVQSPKLKKLMVANRDRVSFAIAELDVKGIDEATKHAKQEGGFVPLADVADVIWKNLPSDVTGGRDTSFRAGPEHPVHYADIDEPRASDGKTLRDICLEDPANVDVAVWQAFYDDLGHTASKERGLLPFRVWQFFDTMVGALHDNDLTAFVCAAGLVAHYVGDACQPLHGSVLADGRKNGKGKGVHSVYETTMIDHRADEIVERLPGVVAATSQPPGVSNGQQAALAIVQLMARAAAAVDPGELVDAYAVTGDGKSKAVTTKLWNQFGTGTLATLADGVVTLGMIWESAWIAGGGNDKFTTQQMVAINRAKLQTLYEDEENVFVPSLDLDHIGPMLR
jgi:hypothetical protein